MMYQIALFCLVLFGLGSSLPTVEKHDPTFVLTREVERKEPNIKGMSKDLDEKVNMLERMSDSGLENNMDEISLIINLDDASAKTSCASLLKAGHVTSGVYAITPPGLRPMAVYCDMTTAGGGWTVIQKRISDEVDFYRTWAEYREFFGDADGNYWLGLEGIHQLTNDQDVELYVNIEDFDGNWYDARYSVFKVDSEDSKYKLTVTGYSGTAGDNMNYHNGEYFSTKDQDNDSLDSPTECAVSHRGAWWYHKCGYANLNGVYYNTESSATDSMHWRSGDVSLKSAVMMIRPVNF